jgi:hypothetical protein
MTKLDIIRENKKAYADLEKKIPAMTGIEKAVAENLTLKWIKGNKWMGGLSDSVHTKADEKLMAMGYELEEIEVEFNRQQDSVLKIK